MPYFVVGPDGKESGPFELEVLIDWVRAGQLPRHAPVRDSISQSPVQAGQMIELSQHFPPPVGPASTGSAILPTGNPDALWGYYLGFASLVCVLGLAVAPVAYIKAAKGLKAHKANPAVHGKAHAIVGIVLATLGTLGNLGLVALFVVNL